jgi:hypothetical protein
MKKILLLIVLLLSFSSYSQDKEITLKTSSVLLKDSNLVLNFIVYWKISNGALVEYYPSFNKEEIYPIFKIIENTQSELSFYVNKKGHFVEYRFSIIENVLHVVSVKRVGTTIVTYDYY